MAGNIDQNGGRLSATTHRSTHNRKKLTEEELNALPPQQRSRYLAYEAPSKAIVEQQLASRKRVFEKVREEKLKYQTPADEEFEKQQHEKLIGQLKAAEARNRIRITRLRYESSRADEVKQLVASQPSAVTAVRLEALLPIKKDSYAVDDPLNKISRDRVERLMSDNLGLSTGRS